MSFRVIGTPPGFRNSLEAVRTGLRQRKIAYSVLTGILLLALYPRILNISWAIPEYHWFMGGYMNGLYPDEPNLVQPIKDMRSDALSNTPFIYPPLQAQIGVLLSWILSITATSKLFLLARMISVIASVLMVLCVYCLRFARIRHSARENQRRQQAARTPRASPPANRERLPKLDQASNVVDEGL